MPSPYDKQIEQVIQMVAWMLENGSNLNQTFYLGTAGAFRTISKPNGATGVYSLTAGYAENGISGVPDSQKHGEQNKVFKAD